MPWLSLDIESGKREWPRLEAALRSVGALSTTLLDAADEPILEPAPGRTPLWKRLHVQALFDAATDRRGLVAVLEELVPGLDRERIRLGEIADQAWERAWMDEYRPMRFGRRLWIYPSTIEPPEQADQVVVRLDPGLAFGTGTHATTALCLEWLDGLALTGRRVIDFGAGSGVLAIAALLLGAREAIAIDNDPQALEASADNAARNGVADRLVVLGADDPPPAAAEVVVANILAGTLIELAPQLVALLAPGGVIALSGVLATQADEVADSYRALGIELTVSQREDWVRLDGQRPA
jgi:ribosomal protein L11 methyltransferase